MVGGALTGERGAAFLLPGPGGGVGHREGRAARVGGGPPRQPAAAGPRQAASADDAAAPPQPPGEPRAPPPPAAPAPWPSPPPSLTHPPGRLGPRPSRRSSFSPHSLRPGCSCRSPASQPPGRFLFLLLPRLSFHTHTSARPGLLGRPIFSNPPHPHSPLNAAVGGGRRIDVPSASCSRRRGR